MEIYKITRDNKIFDVYNPIVHTYPPPPGVCLPSVLCEVYGSSENNLEFLKLPGLYLLGGTWSGEPITLTKFKDYSEYYEDIKTKDIYSLRKIIKNELIIYGLYSEISPEELKLLLKRESVKVSLFFCLYIKKSIPTYSEWPYESPL